MTFSLSNKSFRTSVLAVILAIGIASSIFISQLSYRAENKLMLQKFSAAVESRNRTLERELEIDVSVVTSLQALNFHSTKDEAITRQEFRHFTNHFLNKYEDIQAVEWIPSVPDSRREEYESSARRDGFADFLFSERTAQGKMKRAEKRKEYFPVYFVEPYKGNEAALGFDLTSDAALQESFKAVRKSGKIFATTKAEPVPWTTGQSFLMLFAPVYQKGALLNSDQARLDSFVGFAGGVFKIESLVKEAMYHLSPVGIDFVIYDASGPGKEKHIYTHVPRAPKGPQQDIDHPQTPLRITKTLDVSGLKWVTTYSATPEFIAAESSRNHWVFFLLGLSFTGFVAGSLLLSIRHLAQLEIHSKDLSEANANLTKEIMERKRIKETLQNSEKEFRTLAEAMPQIVWITRPDGWNIYFNQRWMDYTGLTLEESYGHGWNKPFHPDDQQRAWEAWQNAVNNFAEYSLKCRLRRADGIYKWWLIRGVPMQDSEGTILKWFGTCTDIDDIKRTEEALFEKERLLSESQRLGHIGSFLFDKTGQLSWSEEMYHLCGVSPDTFTPNVESLMGLIHPDDRSAMQAWIGTCIAGEHPDALDFQIILPDGTIRFIRGTGEAVFDEKREFLYLAGLAQDITERKQAEQDLRRFSFELEQNNRELQDALGNVKQLTGLLPICASCKQIRDDGGYWHGVEMYIAEHSSAEFSHGICPECEKKAYEELDNFKNENI